MPISGLVITLEQGPAGESAIGALDGEAHVEMGVREGCRVAVVLDTLDRHTDKQMWEWVNGLDGVVFVDVVFVHFDEPGSQSVPLTCSAGGSGAAPATMETL